MLSIPEVKLKEASEPSEVTVEIKVHAPPPPEDALINPPCLPTFCAIIPLISYP